MIYWIVKPTLLKKTCSLYRKHILDFQKVQIYDMALLLVENTEKITK